jgi:hypothetical protein
LGLRASNLAGSDIQNNLVEHHATDLIVFFLQVKAFFKRDWVVFVELIVARTFLLKLKVVVQTGLTHFNFNIAYLQWSRDLRKDFDSKLVELIDLDRRVFEFRSGPEQMTACHHAKQFVRLLASLSKNLIVLHLFNKFDKPLMAAV